LPLVINTKGYSKGLPESLAERIERRESFAAKNVNKMINGTRFSADSVRL